ncbi:hypothetical protein G6011_08093 [Alternaria panax]|uniref:Uncharacterized protein n=1 Tax=Alternaria panax TaxID=48097 RepID=A0AAD4I5U7_9PLEO|nr:hypothetical protein G6011_08093 [Alternaria panax]
MLIKFKAFSVGLDATPTCALPSWEDGLLHYGATLEEIEDSGQYNPYEWTSDDGLAARKQFWDDNTDSAIPHTNLVVRGIADLRFYISGDRILSLMYRKQMWKLDFESGPGDLIVSLASFETFTSHLTCDIWFERKERRFSEFKEAGVWLLRPARFGSDQEFRLMAFLAFVEEDELPFYAH